MKKEVTKCMVVFYILIETSVFIKKFAKKKDYTRSFPQIYFEEYYLSHRQ